MNNLMKSNWLVSAVISFLIMSSTFSLSSCGGGGGGAGGGASTAPLTPIQTTITTAYINVAEIGGTSLKVLSAHDGAVSSKAMSAHSAVISSATSTNMFTVAVSIEGTQLLSVVDSDIKLRALMLSVVNTATNIPAIATVDAISTATSLIFLTPGILTTDSTQTKTHIDEIQSMISFPALVNYLRLNLPTVTLDVIVLDVQYNTLLTACINEWLQNHPLAIPLKPKKGSAAAQAPSVGSYFTIDPIKADVRVNINQTVGNLQTVKFDISNFGARYINIYRRLIDSMGTPLMVSEVGVGIKGAVPLSWGSLLSGSVASPTKITESSTLDFMQNDIGTVEYWIIGPGLQASVDTLPSEIPGGVGDVAYQTIVNYFIYPLVDIWIGGQRALGSTPEQLKLFLNSYTASNAAHKANLLASIDTLDKAAFQTAFINIAKDMISIGLASGAFVSLGLLTSAQAAAAGTALAGVTAVLGAANVIIATTEILRVPKVTKIKAVFAGYTPSLPWYAKNGVYKVYGTNTFVAPTCSYTGDNYALPQEADWVFIGESNTTATFQTNSTYKSIMIGWSGTPTLYFDALVDQNSGQAWGFDSTQYLNNGECWFTTYMENYAVNTSEAWPSNFTGVPDGNYSFGVGTNIGFSLTPFSTTVNPGTGKGSITVYATTTVPATTFVTSDLQGVWSGTYSTSGATVYQYTVSQNGTITSSTDPDYSNGSGSIQPYGAVTITINMPSGDVAVLTGTVASDKTAMSGTFTVNGTNAGTWNWTKSANTTYSDATLTGTWIIVVPSVMNTASVFNGSGGISQSYDFQPATPPGTYQVQSNGSFTATFNFTSDPQVVLNGILSTSTTGTFNGSQSGQPFAGSIEKVTDLSSCQGTWSGNLTETSGGSAVRSLTLTIDATGHITTISGFNYSGNGTLFCGAASNVASFIPTSEAGGYQNIKFYGSISGSTIIGNFENSANIRGTVSLAKQ